MQSRIIFVILYVLVLQMSSHGSNSYFVRGERYYFMLCFMFSILFIARHTMKHLSFIFTIVEEQYTQRVKCSWKTPERPHVCYNVNVTISNDLSTPMVPNDSIWGLVHSTPTRAIVTYLSCTWHIPVMDLSQTYHILVTDLSEPVMDLPHTCHGPVTDPYFILIGWLPINRFVMLNFYQSLYSKIGLIIIKAPKAPLHHLLKFSGPPSQ